ncbi:helix-turn-helix domain-containing protein [Owenweeksia hongkongensis]|uniref:helix-turn-helix domain-containing protein n=1 Tax=Owenweeksia hongkongensis TaxID=253245 RepID=UPI003A8F315B
MEDIAQRIKELIDDQGLSNTDFAKEANLNPAIISHILSGRNKPSLQVINQIKESFTNVNLDYLITGSGQLYIDITNVNTKDKPVENNLFGQVGGLPMEGVRVVSEPGTIPAKAPEEPVEKTTEIEKPAPPSHSLNEHLDKKPKAVENSKEPDVKEVEQIVIFYTDGSFKAYRP